MVIKQPTKLIVTNPGGLWGLTERELGTTSPRARNAVMYKMCSAITSESGARVIEGHATGIPEVRRSLREAFLPEPFFKDGVISFTAIITSSTVLPPEDVEWLSTLPANEVLSVAQKHALVAMQHGEEISNSIYRSRFPMDSVEARDELQELVQFGLAHITGAGRSTAYALGPGAPAESTDVALPGMDLRKPATDRDSVIEALRRFERPVRRSEIVQATGLTGNQAYRALKELISKGVVATDKDPADKRAFRYFLTDPNRSPDASPAH